MKNENIVFGTGPLALWVMHYLTEEGTAVTLVNRSGKTDHHLPENVKIVAGNLTDPDQVKQICKNADKVFHCAMPPYTEWPEKFPPLTKGIIEGLSGSDTKLIFGDNLYMYGSTGGKPIHEDIPYSATGHKGKVRAQTANAMFEAHTAGELKVTIGRGSDFFGPLVTNAVFGEIFFKPVFAGKAANLLGNIDLPHTFTYIKDFAKALIVLSNEEKAYGRAWHVPSVATISTRAFLSMVEDEMGMKAKVRVAGKTMISIMGLFSPVIKEVKEMMYTWTEPYVVNHSQFEEAFGLRATPFEKSVKETVSWMKQRYKQD